MTFCVDFFNTGNVWRTGKDRQRRWCMFFKKAFFSRGVNVFFVSCRWTGLDFDLGAFLLYFDGSSGPTFIPRSADVFWCVSRIKSIRTIIYTAVSCVFVLDLIVQFI